MFRYIGQVLRRLAAPQPTGADDAMERLDTSEQLAQCLDQSNEAPVFIFKHSTRCPVSAHALEEMNSYIQQRESDSPPVYINYVVEGRPVAREIAEKLDLQHASPQLLLVDGGRVVWHTSHGGVEAGAVARAAAEGGD